ncbi:MAG: hypothetical protein COW12_05750 [Candidatus Omnitrophica bacterium CG12_big_fil_rev_8_21_14_0_65_45_16]|nr:MAG: hypothetical protein COW12_05750 [Candidatus Omnitrophica bacterium CG12_big_fil_rev_8_21_14_0_65_45_16]
MNKTANSQKLFVIALGLYVFSGLPSESYALDLSLRDNFGKKSQFDTASYSSSSSSYDTSYGGSYISPALEASMANLGQSMGEFFAAAAAAQARAAAQRQQGLSFNKTGNAYFENGDWTNAISYYETALQYIPNDLTVQRNLRRARANLLNQQGVALHDRGDYAGAIKLYQQALSINPENTTIRSNLRLAEQTAGRETLLREETLLKEKMDREKLKLLPSIFEIFSDMEPPANEPLALDFEEMSELRDSPAEVKTPPVPIEPMPRGNLDIDPDLTKNPKTPWAPGGSTKALDQLGAAFGNASEVPALSETGAGHRASLVFDTQAPARLSVQLPGVPVNFEGVEIQGGAGLPDITEKEMNNPALKPFVKEWQANDLKMRTAQTQLDLLNEKPNKTSADFMAIAKTKQDLTQAENKINFIRYQIKKQLQQPPEVPALPAPAIKKEPPLPAAPQKTEDPKTTRVIMTR